MRSLSALEADRTFSFGGEGQRHRAIPIKEISQKRGKKKKKKRRGRHSNEGKFSKVGGARGRLCGYTFSNVYFRAYYIHICTCTISNTRYIFDLI
jgi:hypothetical protein